MKQSITLNRWTVGASIEKLIKDEGFAACARATAADGPSCGCGRSNLWPKYSKRLYVFPGIKSIHF
jgi:hypothetical protein